MDPSKKPKQIKVVEKSKLPQEENRHDSFYSLQVSFSFRKYDANAPWSTSSNLKPTVDSVFSNLRGVEGATWGSLISSGSGKNKGNKSHYVPVNKLSSNAINRINDIRLEEDSLFSLRIQSDVRLWGIIEPKNGCFYIIWFDPEHQVYTVNKR